LILSSFYSFSVIQIGSLNKFMQNFRIILSVGSAHEEEQQLLLVQTQVWECVRKDLEVCDGSAGEALVDFALECISEGVGVVLALDVSVFDELLDSKV